MPYSPIKLKQLDSSQIAGFINDVVGSGFVEIIPNQIISGEKSFVGIVKVSDGSGIKFLENLFINESGAYIKSGEIYSDTQNRFLNGNWKTNTIPSNSGDLINKNYFDSGISNFVSNTGNETISGEKNIQFPTLNTVKKNRTLVNSTTYNVLPSDYYIATISNSPKTVLSFPNLSGNKQEFIVKDISGLASGYNIILSGNGVTFDNSPTYTLNINYQSTTLIAGNGSNYEIL